MRGVRYISWFFLLLFGLNLYAANLPMNLNVSDPRWNAMIGIALSGLTTPVDNNSYDYTLGEYLERKIEKIVNSQEFKNYLNHLLRKAFNKYPDSDPYFDRNTFKLIIPKISGSVERTYQLFNWYPRPFTGSCIPGMNACYDIYLLNTDELGGYVGKVPVDRFTVNPAGNIIDYDGIGVEVFFSGTTGYANDDIAVKFTINNASLDVLIEPSVTHVGKNTPITERMKYLKGRGKLHFNAELTVKFKIIADNKYYYSTPDDYDLGRIGVYFKDFRFDITKFQLELTPGPFGPGDRINHWWTYYNGRLYSWAAIAQRAKWVRCGFCNLQGKYYPLADTLVTYYDTPDCTKLVSGNHYWIYTGTTPVCSSHKGQYIYWWGWSDFSYNISQKLFQMLPYIQGELRVILQEEVDSSIKPYIGTYVLVDMNDIFRGTDQEGSWIRSALKLHGLFNDVSGDGEFGLWSYSAWENDIDTSSSRAQFVWSNYYLSFNTVFGLNIVNPPDPGTEFTSSYGLIDGWGGTEKKDDPYLITSVWGGATPDFRHNIVAGTGKVIPVWGPAYYSATYADRQNPIPFKAILSIHQNLFNSILYSMVINSFFNVKLERKDLGDSKLADLLNTESWRDLFPKLYEHFHDESTGKGYDMLIRVMPAFKDLPSSGIDSRLVPRVYVGGKDVTTKIVTDHYEVYPDLTVDFPRLYIEFYVVDRSANDTLRKVFTIVTSLLIGVDFDMQDNLSGNYGTTYTIDYTHYPIGCGVSGRPCEISFKSKKVLKFGFMVAGNVLHVVEGADMPDDLTSEDSGITTQEFNNAISNLIAMILGAKINFYSEIVFDPGALLGIPITFSLPYVGPNWWYPTNSNVKNQCGNYGDQDSNCFGDRLTMAFDFDDGFGDSLPRYAVRLIDNIINRRSDIMAIWNYDFEGGAGSPMVSDTKVVGEGEEIPFFKASIDSVAIDREKKGIRISVSGGSSYSFKLDDGLWTPFVKTTSYEFKGVFPEGKHTVSVLAMDEEGHIQPEPTTRTLMFDVTPPYLEITSLKETDEEATLEVSAYDGNGVTLYYSVDNGDFLPLRGNVVSIDGRGHHHVVVKAVDGMGNVSMKSLDVTVGGEGSLGCSSGGNGSADWLLLSILFLGLFVYIRIVRCER